MYTLCVFYLLLSYTAARPSTVLTTPSINYVLLAASTGASTVTHTGSTTSHTTLHTTLPETHGPHVSTHTVSPLPISNNPSTQSPVTPASSSPQEESSQTHHPITASTIVGIVFGGLAGLVLVLSVGRCWWSWRKTPSRDRIESLMHRYDLDREMEQARVEPLREIARRLPPPPYRPPPPGYEHVVPSSLPPAHLEMSVEEI